MTDLARLTNDERRHIRACTPAARRRSSPA
jgi:hypothetical protein